MTVSYTHLTEQLKAENPMKWVRMMNNIRERVNEVVNAEKMCIRDRLIGADPLKGFGGIVVAPDVEDLVLRQIDFGRDEYISGEHLAQLLLLEEALLRLLLGSDVLRYGDGADRSAGFVKDIGIVDFYPAIVAVDRSYAYDGVRRRLAAVQPLVERTVFLLSLIHIYRKRRINL